MEYEKKKKKKKTLRAFPAKVLKKAYVSDWFLK